MIDTRPYLLAPYVDGGRDLETGVDCWAVVREFYRREFAIELPSFAGAYDTSENERLVSGLIEREASATHFQRVETPEAGDVVRLWWRRKDDPSHVGIYLGESQMLHARKGGVMVDSLTDDFFARRVVDYWRHSSRIKSWRLAVSQNPLSDDFVTVEAPAGSTILEALAVADVRRDRDGGSIRVVVGGDVVPPEWWPRIRPKAGQLVSAQSVPGPPIIAALALIGVGMTGVAGGVSGAVAGALMGIGVSAATAFAVGALAVYGIAAGVTIGVSLLSASLGSQPDPKRPAGAVGPAQSPLAAGTGNQLERWAKVAVGYGTMRIFPHLAAPAWTEIDGADRFWRILLCVGAGRYQIDQTATLGRTGIEVGGVAIEDLVAAGAEWEIFEGGGTFTYDATVLDVEPVDDSPVGYWTLADSATPALNEIAGGVSLVGINGASFGHATILAGQTDGGSVTFDGVNDYLRAASSIPLSDLSGDWSAECWAKFTRDSQSGAIATILARGIASDGFDISVEKASSSFVVSLGGVVANVRAVGITSEEKTWHLVLRRKAGILTLWANGLGSISLSTATPINPTSQLTVGAGHTGTQRYQFFAGSVERIALYDVALSDDEIRLHYDLGTRGASKTRILVDSPKEVPINEQIIAPNSLDFEWYIGKWITREIPGISDELSVEMFYPGGVYRIAKKGYLSGAFVGYNIEYKEAKSDTWLLAASLPAGQSYGQGAGHFNILWPYQAWGSFGGLVAEHFPTAAPDDREAFYVGGQSQEAFIVGRRWKVPPGEYTIRFRNFAGATFSDRGGGANTSVFMGDCILLSFRGTKHNEQPVRTDKVSLVGVYLPVKETGSTVGQISVIRSRMVKQYIPTDPLADADGMTPERVTNNAAWSYLDWLTNPDVNARPLALSKVNLPAIADFATRAKPTNLEIDYAGNVWDTAGTILGPSLASIGYAASKWTVVEDRDGKTPRQLLTARNGSGWRWMKRFVDVPHAYRVAILDEAKQYQDLEVIVFDDPYNEDGSGGKIAATQYQTLDARGITNRDQAIEYGKRLLRMLRLRHEEFSAEVLFESLTAKRGDLVLANIPTALIGQRAATIIEVHVNLSGLATYVLIDELVTYSVGINYGCRLRIVDPAATTQYAIIQADVTNPATTVSVEQRRLTFSTPIPVINVPPVGALIAFGERGEEAQECLVRDIQRKPGFVAGITLIPYAPEIFNPIDEPAVFDPIVANPVPLPELRMPLPPTILAIDSDENYLAFTPTGIQVRMRVVVQIARHGRTPARMTQVRALDVGIGALPNAWVYSGWLETFPSIHWLGPVRESTYEVQARSQTAAGVASNWSTPVSHRVIGQSTPPKDVLEVRREGDSILWVYDEPPLDLNGFLVRFRKGAQIDAPWSTAEPAHVGVIKGNTFRLTSIPYIAVSVTIMVKAVDYAGNESVNAAVLSITASGIDPANVLLTIDHRALGWTGTKTDCAVDSGDLAVDQEAGDDTQPMWTEWRSGVGTRMWSKDRTDAMWTSPFSKLATYVTTWTPGSESVGKRLVLDYASTPSEANVRIAYDEQGASPMWHADTDAMWTTDAALMWEGFSAWKPWPGQLLAPLRKKYGWRVTMYPMRAGRPRLTQFQIISDVDDRRLAINDFVVSAMGSRLPVGEPFHAISVVTLTKQDIVGETAAKLTLVDREPYGPMVYAYDIAGNMVAATIDAEVVGY